MDCFVILSISMLCWQVFFNLFKPLPLILSVDFLANYYVLMYFSVLVCFSGSPVPCVLLLERVTKV